MTRDSLLLAASHTGIHASQQPASSFIMKTQSAYRAREHSKMKRKEQFLFLSER